MPLEARNRVRGALFGAGISHLGRGNRVGVSLRGGFAIEACDSECPCDLAWAPRFASGRARIINDVCSVGVKEVVNWAQGQVHTYSVA